MLACVDFLLTVLFCHALPVVLKNIFYWLVTLPRFCSFLPFFFFFIIFCPLSEMHERMMRDYCKHARDDVGGKGLWTATGGRPIVGKRGWPESHLTPAGKVTCLPTRTPPLSAPLALLPLSLPFSTSLTEFEAEFDASTLFMCSTDFALHSFATSVWLFGHR
jgi:hypothetical protein